MVFVEIEGINPKKAKTILTPTKGSLKAFTHSLNPYSGCLFDCSYCYVPKGFELTIGNWANEHWGKWVEPKLNAQILLKKQLKQMKEKLSNLKIFMGSVTDPYQPIEKQYKITKSLLDVFSYFPVKLLTIQTRSPLIIRDIDLLKKINAVLRGNLNVNMTITSNNEQIRKYYEPKSASYYSRRLVIKKLTDAGIKTTASVSPLLPCDPEIFVNQLSDITHKVSFEPIIVDSRNETELKNSYIGALTREKFYTILLEEEKKFFTKEYYNNVVKIFTKKLGAKRVIDRYSTNSSRSDENLSIRKESRIKQVSLTNYLPSA